MTRRVLLLGEGLWYSASPAIQNVAFASAGIDAVYALHDISPDGLDRAVRELRTAAYLGANVTTPHKRAVISLVDRRSADVDRLEAANTLVHIGGELVGYNTDLDAMRAELTVLCPRPSGAAVVLGAGGASAAVQAALADLGWDDVRVVRRDRWSLLEGHLMVAGLLVNATPVGTGSDETPVPARWLRPDLAVLDLVYRPSPSPLVRDARAAGAPARGGAGVLLRQAAASFTLWTGLPAPMEPMRSALQRELGALADV